MIEIEWSTLKDYLRAADDVVTVIDRKIASSSLRKLELHWLLETWKATGRLPSRKDLWSELHQMGFGRTERSDKGALERQLYC
jgi:hypothetical protein